MGIFKKSESGRQEVPKAAPPPAPSPQLEPEYGIRKAIELMRALPNQNIELEVQVVKSTLESMTVSVSTIIDDATRKQARIQGRIEELEQEITAFEQQIAARRKEITVLKEDYEETTMVKKHLSLAQRLTQQKGKAKAKAKASGAEAVAPAPASEPAG